MPQQAKNRDLRPFYGIFCHFTAFFTVFWLFLAFFGFNRQVPVRTPQEKAHVLVCLARSSGRMGPPALVGAELRAEKAPAVLLWFGATPFRIALNGRSRAAIMPR